jgi:hypothetical protein
MPRSISRAIDERVERLFESGDAVGRLDAAARDAADSFSKTESALKSLLSATAATKQKLWDGIEAFGLQSRTLLGSGNEGGAKDAIRKKAACLSLVQRLEGIASEASGIQAGLEASKGRLVRSADASQKNMREKNARRMGAGLYEELTDALFVLKSAEGRLRQIEAKNQSIDELINAMNDPKTTSNNEVIMREFEKIVISWQVEEELAKLKSGSVRS